MRIMLVTMGEIKHANMGCDPMIEVLKQIRRMSHNPTLKMWRRVA